MANSGRIKGALLTGLILLVSLCLFPPFQFHGKRQGFHFILNPPERGGIDVSMLSVECAIVALLASILYFVWDSPIWSIVGRTENRKFVRAFMIAILGLCLCTFVFKMNERAAVEHERAMETSDHQGAELLSSVLEVRKQKQEEEDKRRAIEMLSLQQQQQEEQQQQYAQYQRAVQAAHDELYRPKQWRSISLSPLSAQANLQTQMVGPLTLRAVFWFAGSIEDIEVARGHYSDISVELLDEMGATIQDARLDARPEFTSLKGRKVLLSSAEMVIRESEYARARSWRFRQLRTK